MELELNAHAVTGIGVAAASQLQRCALCSPCSRTCALCSAVPECFFLCGVADYVRLLKYGDSLYRCKELKRAAMVRCLNTPSCCIRL